MARLDSNFVKSHAMTTDSGDDTRYSIVIPVFNQDAVLPILPRRVLVICRAPS